MTFNRHQTSRSALFFTLHELPSNPRAPRRGLDFSSESWTQLVKEIHQSAENETHGLAWRETVWRPRMRERVGAHGSLWSWLGGLDAASEEAQLAWEVCAAFDGHLTHPCAKTKLPMSLE